MVLFCVPLGFVLAAQKNLDIAAAIVLVAAAALGLVAAHFLPRNRTLAVLGGSLAVIAAWLLPQPSHDAAAPILTFLFCFELDTISSPLHPRPATRTESAAPFLSPFLSDQ